jgi:uncharacterized membrane protein
MKKERFWEIDSARGIAIIKMVIFNYSFALSFLNIYTFKAGLSFPGWAAAVFIFLVGLSLTISYSRIKKKKPREIYKKFFSRGLKVFGLGILISIITFLTFPEYFIIFGILHFIGISIIIGQFFLKFRRLNIILGTLVIVLGLNLQNFVFNFPWLLWLGFTPKQYSMFDYFPILPWFGFTLLGIAFGNTFYKNGKRIFKIRDFSNSFIVRFLSLLGRNSLIIYLVHQPLLIMFLLALGFKIF